MDAYSGSYYVQGGEQQDATFLFLKDKLSIGLRDKHGQPLVVYWPYEQIQKQNFWRNGRAVVHNNGYPVQTIEVESREFLEKLEAVFKENEKSWIKRKLNRNVVHMFNVLLIVLGFFIAGYLWVIPFLAERLAKRVPVSYEEQLGGRMFEAMKQDFIIDEEKTAYINDFFKELKIPTAYNITITVVKEDIANAFAMPGGNIVVYDRILAGMDHYEDLAALLAHEFTHVNKKHTTRSLFRQFGSTIFISVIFGDVGSIGNMLIRRADNLKGLNYSRSLEKDADLDGLKILSDRKIDCNGFVRLFQFLEKESIKKGEQPAEWISSHPDLEKRIRYIKNAPLFNINGTEQNETLETLFLKIKKGN